MPTRASRSNSFTGEPYDAALKAAARCEPPPRCQRPVRYRDHRPAEGIVGDMRGPATACSAAPCPGLPDAPRPPRERSPALDIPARADRTRLGWTGCPTAWTGRLTAEPRRGA